MVGSQTESSMSPITTDDDGGHRSDGVASPELITLREVGHLRDLPPAPRTTFAARAREPVTRPAQEESFEMVEQPTSSSGSADEADYVQVGKFKNSNHPHFRCTPKTPVTTSFRQLPTSSNSDPSISIQHLPAAPMSFRSTQLSTTRRFTITDFTSR